MDLKDSGERRSFESGAVRDVADGKGRCDLLPLDVIGKMFGDEVLLNIHEYMSSGDEYYVFKAIYQFINSVHKNHYNALLELAKQYEDGAKKYDERNWEKGINLHVYIDSGIRHYLKHKRGDKDEPHDRAFLWNMYGLIWTQWHRPEMIDLPFKKEVEE